MILSVDAGKSSIKMCKDDYKNKFQNLVMKSKDKTKPSNENSFEIEFNKERFLIGDSVNAVGDMSSNKILEYNKLAIYTSIANALKEAGIKKKLDIYLATGLPNQHYSTGNIKAIKKLLADDVSLKIDGERYKFTIQEDNILVLSENYSVGYKNIPKALVLDIGYRHININVITNGIMEQEFMTHSETGIFKLKEMIAQALELHFNQHFYAKDITENVITNGLPQQKEKSKEIIENTIENYVDLIMYDVESKGIKLLTMSALILKGGGTHLIKSNVFSKKFKIPKEDIKIDGDEYRNAIVYYEIAKIMFKDKIKEQKDA